MRKSSVLNLFHKRKADFLSEENLEPFKGTEEEEFKVLEESEISDLEEDEKQRQEVVD